MQTVRILYVSGMKGKQAGSKAGQASRQGRNKAAQAGMQGRHEHYAGRQAGLP